MKIFIIAGEASGDQLGAAVLKSLHKLDGNLNARGIGGMSMKREGLRDCLFPMEELSLMGVAEIVPEIPHMLKRIRQTVEAIRVFNPDIVLSIDCPEFSLRVQKALSKTKSKARRIHMVAPTVWAWRPKRAEKIAKYLDTLLCLYPFEPPYFEKEGLKSVFIGHTMMGSGILNANGAAFRFRHMIGHDQKILGLFFGSRKAEIEKCSKLILDAACKLRDENPDLVFVAPTIERWKNFIEDEFEERGLPGIVTDDAEEKWDSFAACNAAIAVSGTVALELAVANVPHVIVYRMNPLTWSIMDRIVSAKYAHIANIILDREAVPEFIQNKAQADRVVPILSNLLNDGNTRNLQISDFDVVRSALQSADKKNPADVAAEFLIKSITN